MIHLKIPLKNKTLNPSETLLACFRIIFMI